jgi:hypothetical protein
MKPLKSKNIQDQFQHKAYNRGNQEKEKEKLQVYAFMELIYS